MGILWFLLGTARGRGATKNRATVLWNRIHALWAPQGSIQLVDLDNDYYLVKFAAEEDYAKVLTEGPWTIFGNYLIVQPWSRGFLTNLVFPSQVIVWERLPGLPYRHYTKSLFRRIAAILGRVVRVDYNTHGGDRGKFARLTIMLDLTKPLRSCIGIDGFIQWLEYEGLQNICFGCGTYGHAKEHCGNPEHAGTTHNSQGNRSFPLSNKQVDKVSSEDLFGPWMVVEDRRRRPRRNDNTRKQMPTKISGSRFEILNNLPVDEETTSMRAFVGGTSKQINSPVVLQSPVVRVNGHQGVKFNPKQQDNSGSGNTSSGASLNAKVVAMVSGRVPTVLFKDASGSTLQHQAITIVEEGDGREEGISSISRAGLNGVGKKKVHFKKKFDLKLPAGGCH
ncbi:hypothetical protein GQ457_16G019820 [Hibiscus cannabinus]